MGFSFRLCLVVCGLVCPVLSVGVWDGLSGGVCWCVGVSVRWCLWVCGCVCPVVSVGVCVCVSWNGDCCMLVSAGSSTGVSGLGCQVSGADTQMRRPSSSEVASTFVDVT